MRAAIVDAAPKNTMSRDTLQRLWRTTFKNDFREPTLLEVFGRPTSPTKIDFASSPFTYLAKQFVPSHHTS